MSRDEKIAAKIAYSNCLNILESVERWYHSHPDQSHLTIDDVLDMIYDRIAVAADDAIR